MKRIVSYHKAIGLILGIAVVIAVSLAPLEGISREGQLCFAFTLMSVAFWIFKVMDSSFVAGLFLMLLVIFQVGEPATVFAAWTDPLMWLVIGSFLIAQAVVESGLGSRLTYWLLIKTAKSFRSLIVVVFLISILLSLLIPNPWPRAFILAGVMKEVAASTSLGKKDKATLGLSVFAGSIPTSLIFLTGAASMNQLILSFAGISVNWIEWFVLMGVPGLALTGVYLVIMLLFFPLKGDVRIDKELIQQKLVALGSFTKKEKWTLIWLVIAVILWMTDGVHGINLAWTTMGVSMFMALPIGGSLITPANWKGVPMSTIVYLTAAVAIGRVGTASGMTVWITDTLFPSVLPENIFLLGLAIAGVCMLLHMFLGSTITSNSVIIPSMLLCVQGTGMPPVICALICYTAIFGHFVFSYQHMNILLGIGENGMYGEQDSLKMVIPLTIAVPLTILVAEIPWWKLIGIL